MKRIFFISILVASLSSCEKIIDIDPLSNVGADAFYRDYKEVSTALTGCYQGMHAPLYNEWMMTDLRTDLSLQGDPNSSSADRIELNELDMFTLNADHNQVYKYWMNTYLNIRAANYLLTNIGIRYNNGDYQIDRNTNITEDQWKQVAGEALFLRAYHYFNMVRLFSNIFMVTEPVDPNTSKLKNFNTKQEVYDLIVGDLQKSMEYLPSTQYQNQNKADLGRVTHWASQALLAKVYLTLGKKTEALTELNEIIANSGHQLLNSYSDVFSISNEMNAEIIFAVRYKAGGFGLGSPFANLFVPTGSSNTIVNYSGDGMNWPTQEAMTMYSTSHVTNKDNRYAITLGYYSPSSKPYVRKYLSQVSAKYDAENDAPIIRYADVLLMKAEAMGYDGANGEAVKIINQIRERAGAVDYDGTSDFVSQFFKYPATGSNSIVDEDSFTDALLNERKLELAFENQRFFDLVRFGKALEVIQQNFEDEYDNYYGKIKPITPLQTLKSRVTANRLLLPIPLKEITTNNQLELKQNDGY